MARVLLIRQAFVPLDPRVKREIDALRTDGHSIDVICRRRRDEPGRETTEHGIIRRLPGLPGRGGPLMYIIQYAWFMLLATIWVTGLHLRRGYDLVQVNTLPDTLVFAAWLPRLLGVPVVIDLHEVMPEFFATKFGVALDHPFVRAVAALEQLSIRFSTHAVTCTDQMRDAFVARGTPAEKITVVMNSADERIFGPRPSPSHKKPGEFVLVCHGTIEDRYGHEEMVRAVALLRQEIPGLRLLVFGEGAHLPAIRDLVTALSVEQNVWLSEGFVPLEELLDGISGADVGIVAMRRDVFRDMTHCHKMFDYIAMRIPAAVSRTRAVQEYFDEDCFELFEAGDAADLARAIRRLWLEPDRRKQLVQHVSVVNEPYRWQRQELVYRAAIAAVLGEQLQRQPAEVSEEIN
ncbi:MAG TPA: glycosyltransferase family 4 protein [Candidatus Dormibacteraeota bacterium]|nr:glycosyltransferase family 4 protein [Candidatus Dormibacteraeota bacterium]